jgi:hypothetical protein
VEDHHEGSDLAAVAAAGGGGCLWAGRKQRRRMKMKNLQVEIEPPFVHILLPMQLLQQLLQLLQCSP